MGLLDAPGGDVEAGIIPTRSLAGIIRHRAGTVAGRGAALHGSLQRCAPHNDGRRRGAFPCRTVTGNGSAMHMTVPPFWQGPFKSSGLSLMDSHFDD